MYGRMMNENKNQTRNEFGQFLSDFFRTTEEFGKSETSLTQQSSFRMAFKLCVFLVFDFN